MLTLKEIELVHLDHNYGVLFPDKDMWVPIYNDDKKTVRDWFSLGNAHHNGKSHVDEFGYPSWGDIENNKELEAMKGVLFRKEENLRYFKMPARVFSMREVGLNKVVVLMRRQDGEHYLITWDTRTEVREEDCTPNNFIKTHMGRGGEPDRDIDVDIERNWLYCFGDECLNKLSLDTFEYIDSTDMNDRVNLLRLNK